ncbi:hypothetical protein LAZ67_1002991 [Cordylochernes scorpioides]|uniref:DDE-1 domain-containing protein n=1 Tax=Cordylochernes scorpioides TaxID=51811 RepID=A0ABY6JY75_9ARAC|nr:hypothetical protein LAZ67_1002991 [Cordylochernes scorpioides]
MVELSELSYYRYCRITLPLLMIGKAANPRCFKNVKTKPVDYANSARAWMTSYLFEKWLLNLDKKFTKEKRKVILFIDNCTAHNSIPPMENVEVIFFPANMTSVIQPMDKGVIKNLKHFLQTNILTGDSEALKIKLDVLQASRLCKKAWDQVTSETIKHCFKKAGFVKKEEDEENADDIIAETMPSVDGWEDVISNPTISYDDFLNVDDDVAVCGEITDADIIAEVLNHNIEKQDGDEASGDEDESSVAGEMNVPSAAEATNYIMQLRRFFERILRPNVHYVESRPVFRVLCYPGETRSLILLWHTAYVELESAPEDVAIFQGPNSSVVREQFQLHQSSWLQMKPWLPSSSVSLPSFSASCIGLSGPYALQLSLRITSEIRDARYELTTEEIQKLQSQQHTEDMQVIGFEESVEEVISKSEIKVILGISWKKKHPEKVATGRASDLFNDTCLTHFRNILRGRKKQTSLDMFFSKRPTGESEKNVAKKAKTSEDI